METISVKRFVRIFVTVIALAAVTYSAPVPVRHTEGLLRGFLVLSALDGTHLAEGDLSQVCTNDRVTNHLVFRFKDGSVHDETVVFSQRGNFRLLSYHLVQKGPSFTPHTDLSFDSSNLVKVRSAERDGAEKAFADQMDIPDDVANGLVLTLVKNIRPNVPLTTVSMVATTPKPRLVKLAITPQGEDTFSVSGLKYTANHYVVKVDIGGFEGALAKLLKKNPPDIHVWTLGGEAPGFVKLEGPLFYGGPIWRIELASPVWPGANPVHSGK
jgi:hypothetical protein